MNTTNRNNNNNNNDPQESCLVRMECPARREALDCRVPIPAERLELTFLLFVYTSV